MQAEEVVEGLKQIFDELVAGGGFGECCGSHKEPPLNGFGLPIPTALHYLSPPEIVRVSPVIQPESGEARNATAGAMSRGCPMRLSGVWDSICLRKSLSVIPAECVPSVSTMPGFTALTRILRGPNSLASVFVTASTAAFVAL